MNIVRARALNYVANAVHGRTCRYFKYFFYLPFEYPERRSRSWLVGPQISTADTLTENLAPVFCFCSLIPLNSQDIAHGIIPKVFAFSGVPSIVYDFPKKILSFNHCGMKQWWRTDGLVLGGWVFIGIK